MISFIVKFFPVKRYVVAVSLAVVSCFNGFAQARDYYVDCRAASEPYQKAGNDDDWFVMIHCTANLDELVEVKLEDFVQGGGCTNCTAMSPAECQEYKDHVIMGILPTASMIDIVKSGLDDSIDNAVAASQWLDFILMEGDQFEYYPSRTSPPGSSTAERADYLINESRTGIYYQDVQNPTVSDTFSQALGNNNGIYNYYNGSVKPAVQLANLELAGLVQNLLSQKTKLDSTKDMLTSINNYVASIPCTACQSGGGGGSSTNTPSGGSGLCPCSEVLDNIKNVIDEIRDDVTAIRDKVVKWDERIEELKGWADRIEAMLKVCQDALAPIGTNFVAAVEFKDLQGVSFAMDQLDQALIGNSTGFDYSVYGGLGWFSRIEYLLMSIAGVFSHTNAVPAFVVNTDLADEAYDEATADKSKIEQESRNLTGGFTRVHNSARSFFTAVNSLYSSPSSSGEIRFWDGWMNNHGLTVRLDPKIMQSCRVVSSVLWTVAFTFLLYHIVVQGCVIYGKFVMFATTANANFLK